MPHVEDTESRERALQYFYEAYTHQMEGEFDEAIRLYTQSVELYPTAEAYTFRGWTYSFKGDLDRVIFSLKNLKLSRFFPEEPKIVVESIALKSLISSSTTRLTIWKKRLTSLTL